MATHPVTSKNISYGPSKIMDGINSEDVLKPLLKLAEFKPKASSLVIKNMLDPFEWWSPHTSEILLTKPSHHPIPFLQRHLDIMTHLRDTSLMTSYTETATVHWLISLTRSTVPECYSLYREIRRRGQRSFVSWNVRGMITAYVTHGEKTSLKKPVNYMDLLFHEEP